MTKRLTSTIRKCKLCGDSYQPVSARQKWCKICAPDKKSRRRIQFYGVGAPFWEEQFAKQKGLCAICNQKPPMVVDHDHKTGKARALLCHRCNFLVGVEEEDQLKQKIKDYINQFNK